jgi:hypothetical protein
LRGFVLYGYRVQTKSQFLIRILGIWAQQVFPVFVVLYFAVVGFVFCYFFLSQKFANHLVQLGRKSEEELGFAFYWVV